MSYITTPKFRVSYPNVFKPRLNTLSNKEEYSVKALFQKDADLKQLKDAVEAAIISKFGPDKKKWPKLRLPFKDQGECFVKGTDVLLSGHEAGAIYINLKNSKKKPVVVDQRNLPIVDESLFYSGCWARAMVNVYCYGHTVNNGVSISLEGIQKVSEGEPLSGAPRPEEMFSPVVDSDENETTDSLF